MNPQPPEEEMLDGFLEAFPAGAGASGLTDEQVQFLDMSFRRDRKLDTPRKVQLATELGLDTEQVSMWFEDRRARCNYNSSKRVEEEEFSKLRAAQDEDAAAKKRRLSAEQSQILERSFRRNRRLETARKVHLATELGLDTKQVSVWFQNRRARCRSKSMEEEFSKLRAAHEDLVIHNGHLEVEVRRYIHRARIGVHRLIVVIGCCTHTCMCIPACSCSA
jgi:hypothetical protein